MMKCLVLTNGTYGPLRIQGVMGSDLIICADGGANYAHEMGLIPTYIVGDMDSIRRRLRSLPIAGNH